MQVHVPGSGRKAKEVKANKKSPKNTKARVDTGLGRSFKDADREVQEFLQRLQGGSSSEEEQEKEDFTNK
jgi:hypothetical protein